MSDKEDTKEITERREESPLTELWRIAKLVSNSQLIPAHFRGKTEDIFIMFHSADRLGVDRLTTLQSSFVVKGTPGFKASYVLGLANRLGPFKGPIRFDVTGEGDGLCVRAWGVDKETGDRVDGPWVSMRMAKEEGWTKNSKYKTMGELMLRYRAGTFLVRLTCPEVMMGMMTVEELQDVDAAGPRETEFDEVVTIDEALAPAEEPATSGDAIPVSDDDTEEPDPEDVALFRED